MRSAKILSAFLLFEAITIFFTTQLSHTPAAQIAKHNGVITGRVVTGDGHPASEAVVSARVVGLEREKSREVVCDEEGNFKLTELSPGAYIISASLPGYVGMSNTISPEIHRISENVTLTLVRGGVITGRVTDANGEPVEGVQVDLRMIRDLEGRTTSPNFSASDFMKDRYSTDDRGIYRIYGLPPGIYIAGITDTLPLEYKSGSFRHAAPTYYPSARREAANEITVRAGEEITGIDIRCSGERGYTVSGTISGEVESESLLDLVTVSLRNKSSGELEGLTDVIGSRSFYLHGISDGVYELVAQRSDEGSGFSFSEPRQITVKGADIDGIGLKLLKPGSISGRVVLELPRSDEGCSRQKNFSIKEISLHMKKTNVHLQNFSFLPYGYNEEDYLTAPNDKGEFVQKNLEKGHYRIIPDLPDETWYIRALTRAIKGVPQKKSDIARGGISLTHGESVTGVEMVVAKGAARLQGRVVVAEGTQVEEKALSPSRWRVYLVPAEEAAAEDALRYAETITRSDGSFDLKHLAPGKYYLVVRNILEKEQIENQSLLTAWDNLERANLRREAQALKVEIELRPCQKVHGYILSVSP